MPYWIGHQLLCCTSLLARTILINENVTFPSVIVVFIWSMNSYSKRVILDFFFFLSIRSHKHGTLDVNLWNRCIKGIDECFMCMCMCILFYIYIHLCMCVRVCACTVFLASSYWFLGTFNIKSSIYGPPSRFKALKDPTSSKSSFLFLFVFPFTDIFFFPLVENRDNPLGRLTSLNRILSM